MGDDDVDAAFEALVAGLEPDPSPDGAGPDVVTPPSDDECAALLSPTTVPASVTRDVWDECSEQVKDAAAHAAQDGRVFHGADGAVLVALPRPYRALLGSLSAVLASELDDESSAIRSRLVPTAHTDDDTLERSYEELSEHVVVAGRRRALTVVQETLHHKALTGEAADAWMQVVNDARIAFATGAGVTDDASMGRLVQHHPDAAEVLDTLAAILVQLIEATDAL